MHLRALGALRGLPTQRVRFASTSLDVRMSQALNAKESTKVLFLTPSDTALSQAARLRLDRRRDTSVVVELALDDAQIEAAVAHHAPDVVVCPSLREGQELPASVRLNPEIPCLEVVWEHGPGGGRVAVVESCAGAYRDFLWSESAFSAPPTPDGCLPSAAHVYRSRVVTTGAHAVCDAVSKFQLGWRPVLDGDAAGRPTEASWADAPVLDWGQPAAAVVDAIRANDPRVGVRHTIDGQDFLLFDGHLEGSGADAPFLPPQPRDGDTWGGDVDVFGYMAGVDARAALPGSILGTRNGAVLVKCGEGAAWVGQAIPLNTAAPVKQAAGAILPTAAAAPELPGGDLCDPFTPSVLDAATPSPSPTHRDLWASVEDGVATLSFNFYNGAVTVGAAKRLEAAVRALDAREDVRVIVLAGGRDFFCTGIDANAIEASPDPAGVAWASMNALTDAAAAVATASTPVVAAIQGDAAAGGAMLPLAADFVWTHNDVVLNPHYALMGLHGSDLWTYTLPRRVGADTAQALTSSLQPVMGDTAAALGLVDATLTPTREGFGDAVRLRAADLAADARHCAAIAASKTGTARAEALHRARVHETIIARDNLKAPEFAAARRAFVHKHDPVATPLHLSGQGDVSGRLLNGKALADLKLADLKANVAACRESTEAVPTLAVLLVGDRPDSRKYVQHKVKACKRVGIQSVMEVVDPAAVAPTEDAATQGRLLTDALVARVRTLNADAGVHGIIVQLPLPQTVDATRVLAEISPAKDVDGFGAEHLGMLAGGVPKADAGLKPLVPCTAAGIMELLDHYRVPISGKQVVIVGRSPIVGMPSQLLFMKRNATVNAADIHTRNLPAVVAQADILVVAAGSAHLIKGDWVKRGAVVVDVGINFDANAKMVGDVEFAVAKDKAAYITPVPGGVGPMTVAMLMQNTVQAFMEGRGGAPPEP